MSEEYAGRLVVAIRIVATAAAAGWGRVPLLVQALVFLMVLDIATGFLAAYVTRSLSSDVSYRGVARKAIVLLIVATAWILEPFTAGLPVGEAVAGFYLAHEALSVIENAAAVGLPVPEALAAALKRVNGDAGREEAREEV